ncbi:MAG: hypothetical protein LBB08_00750 [Rickettsiales bacterium]|jgi:hypothetical protein|nr:hypothetical protein [Rickettsiales bacterium]
MAKNLISYIALGVSAVALAVAVFGGCHKGPRGRFGEWHGPHPEMMGGLGRNPNSGRPGSGGDRGPRPEQPKPADKADK